nr:hypothetical protein [Nostoc sp. ChiSLP01]
MTDCQTHKTPIPTLLRRYRFANIDPLPCQRKRIELIVGQFVIAQKFISSPPFG